jgi:hypothetical protein
MSLPYSVLLKPISNINKSIDDHHSCWRQAILVNQLAIASPLNPKEARLHIQDKKWRKESHTSHQCHLFELWAHDLRIEFSASKKTSEGPRQPRPETEATR